MKPIKGLRWWMIGLVLTGLVMNYLARNALAVQAAHETGSEDGDRTQGTVQADQQFSRAVPLGAAATMHLMLSQGAGLIDDSIIGSGGGTARSPMYTQIRPFDSWTR